MKNLFLILFVFSLGALSCDRRAKLMVEKSESPSYPMAPPKVVAPAKMVKVNESEIVDRKLIKNGEINFTTKDILASRQELEKACRDFNGYISSEEQQKLSNGISYHQVIRIPAAKFDAFMKVIERIGDHIEYRNITTQDVTEEFIDIEARLKTKKELEVRYHQLLNKAVKIEDMLSIEEQISTVRTEIETMQGRLQYLTNRVGYSTLTVNYRQVVVNDFGFGSRLATSFVTGWNGLLVFLIGIVSAWPFMIFLTLAIWLIARWVKRNYRHNNRQALREVQ